MPPNASQPRAACFLGTVYKFSYLFTHYSVNESDTRDLSARAYKRQVWSTYTMG